MILTVPCLLQFLAMGYMPTAPPEKGCYITGLSLNNALWDTTQATIMPSDLDESTSQVPILHLLPRLKTPTGSDITYRCPVVVSDGGHDMSSESVLLYINLNQKTEQGVRNLTEKNVYISSAL